MSVNKYNDWLTRLGKAWENRNPDAAASLFTNKFTYHETPFDKPCHSKSAVRKLWSEVPQSQKNIHFRHEIILANKKTCLANFHAKFTRLKTLKRAELDGIFLIKLNSKGLCTLFRQWWVEKRFSTRL